MKIFLLGAAMLLGIVMPTHAQQIQGDFDSEWLQDSIGNGALPKTYLRPGKQPKGWQASNVNQKVIMSKTEILITSDGNYNTQKPGFSTKMENKFVGVSTIGSNAPGYISLGNPWVFAIGNIPECDGGTLGGIKFKYRPDSIVGMFKRTLASASEEAAKIIVYAWKGSYYSTVRTNSKGGYTSTEKKPVADQDRIIWNNGLGKDSATENASLIATAEYDIKSNLNEWTRISVPINYKTDSIPEKINVILSSCNYWDRSKIDASNILWADDIKFIYNSQLEKLCYDGEVLSNFQKDVYSYKLLTKKYDPSLISYNSNGKGASINSAYDTATRKLTLTVTGEDYEINPENKHIYTLEFEKPDSHLSDLSIDKESIKNFDKSTYTYEALEIPYDSTRVKYTLVDDLSSVSKNYNEDTGLLTLTVSASDIETNPEHFRTYTIQFRTPPVVKTDNYQFPNSDFEEGWALNKKYSEEQQTFEDESPDQWHSFADAKGPFAGLALLLTSDQTGGVWKTKGIDEGFAVTIMGRQNMMNSISNGNLTTGIINMGFYIATDINNYNYSDVNNKRGNCSFAGIPDSVSVYFRFMPKDKSLGKASMTMILHDKFNYADPSKILGEEDSISHLIARAYTTIDSTDTWKKYTVPFMYNGEKYKESAENYMLASFSTNQTPGAGSHGDSLSIDKIEVIYNSRIDSILINGTPLTDFSKDKYDYDCPTINNDAEVIVYADGIGASVEKTMDNDRKKMTIIVKGNDYIENNDNLHTYTIQFKNTPVSIKDIPMNESGSKDVYDVQGRRVINTQKGIVIQQGKKTLKK